ncbi:MAG: aldose epimerase family protein, partial [Terriglobales bacterium]
MRNRCIAAAALLAGLGGGILMAQTPGVVSGSFGQLPDGRAVHLYTLTGHDGVSVEVTDLGATLVAIRTPDRKGRTADILLGHENAAGYWADTKTYFGALVGRYANRIAKGRFRLDGHLYELPINNPPNSLHGGTEGFSRKLWTARTLMTPEGPAVEMTMVSPDGDQGYPGTMHVRARFTLESGRRLRIDYYATTDQDTVVNLTSHPYFNLAGEGSGTMLSTMLTLHAHHYTPIDATLIPTGVIAPVARTPLDFTRPSAIGARIHADNEQLRFAGGYDFNYVLDAARGVAAPPALAAEAWDPASGRELRVYTTQPGVQFYSGNFLDHVAGKHGHIYGLHDGFALEPQHFPDSPNRPNFPSTELKPGEHYHE